MIKVIEGLTEEVTRLKAEEKLQSIRRMFQGRKVIATEAIVGVLSDI